MAQGRLQAQSVLGGEGDSMEVQSEPVAWTTEPATSELGHQVLVLVLIAAGSDSSWSSESYGPTAPSAGGIGSCSVFSVMEEPNQNLACSETGVIPDSLCGLGPTSDEARSHQNRTLRMARTSCTTV